MDKLKESQIFNILKWVFIFVSAIYVIYATITMRGLYEDGVFLLLNQLNNFANNIYEPSVDMGHPRFIMLSLPQLPLWLCNLVHLQNKFFLMRVYSFTLFFSPLLVLFWNYKLAKRTNRADIFFWHLFTYCAILLNFSIFAVVETLIGAGMHFILWNYLVSDIKYKKRDIISIIFLLICMFATYEYVVFLGLIFFIMHFKYDFENLSLKQQAVKTLIGYGGLIASIFNICFMLGVSGEGSEIQRFLGEATDFWHVSLEFCIVFSFLTVILLFVFCFKKRNLSYLLTSLITILYAGAFVWLLSRQYISITPVWEQHTRSIVCWAVPLIFIFLLFKEYSKKFPKEINYTNLICITLLCGIFQTAWQNINTYYWDKNIKYMKQELAQTNDVLYIPSEHEEISNFWNENLRRYIWHSVYSPTSILFSDTYEQKTLLMHYDTPIDDGNLTFRHALYVPNDSQNSISIPFGAIIDIKNRYWDLTNCAEALDRYNQEHNIETSQ